MTITVLLVHDVWQTKTLLFAMLMITQKYIRLYFPASFKGIFCPTTKYFEKI